MANPRRGRTVGGELVLRLKCEYLCYDPQRPHDVNCDSNKTGTGFLLQVDGTVHLVAAHRVVSSRRRQLHRDDSGGLQEQGAHAVAPASSARTRTSTSPSLSRDEGDARRHRHARSDPAPVAGPRARRARGDRRLCGGAASEHTTRKGVVSGRAGLPAQPICRPTRRSTAATRVAPVLNERGESVGVCRVRCEPHAERQFFRRDGRGAPHAAATRTALKDPRSAPSLPSFGSASRRPPCHPVNERASFGRPGGASGRARGGRMWSSTPGTSSSAASSRGRCCRSARSGRCGSRHDLPTRHARLPHRPRPDGRGGAATCVWNLSVRSRGKSTAPETRRRAVRPTRRRGSGALPGRWSPSTTSNTGRRFSRRSPRSSRCSWARWARSTRPTRGWTGASSRVARARRRAVFPGRTTRTWYADPRSWRASCVKAGRPRDPDT